LTYGTSPIEHGDVPMGMTTCEGITGFTMASIRDSGRFEFIQFAKARGYRSVTAEDTMPSLFVQRIERAKSLSLK